ncbi:hypothetical protein ACWDPI_24140, partial [Streptomyces zhihengii]
MPLLTRFVMKHGASPQEAADAAQEAFAVAYPQWSSIRFPARWLRMVAARAYVRDRLREDLLGDLPEGRDRTPSPSRREGTLSAIGTVS